MNIGQFQAQIDTAWGILKRLELGEDRLYRPSYPPNAAALFRGLSYLDTWKLCYREQYYDFQLTDDSLIQFRVESFDPLCLSYVYYECPYVPSIPFDEFLRDYIGLADWEESRYFRRDFDDYFALSNTKESYTPIRYDYNPLLYTEGLHPASHIHLGHKSNIRIGTKKVLRPISFLCFVIRHTYPAIWQNFVQMTEAEMWVRNIRENLNDVGSEYWGRLDHWEMSLW